MSAPQPRTIVVQGNEAIALRPAAKPVVVRVFFRPDEKGIPKTGPIHFAPSLQIAELGVLVLAVERDSSGQAFAACAPATAVPVALSPGDILGVVI